MYFLFANPQKKDTIEAAYELATLILKSGRGVVLDAWLHELLHIGVKKELSQISQGDIETIISLGGDGTLLRTLPTAAKLGIPVLGINMGRVGFLLEIDHNNFSDIIDRLGSKNYQLEERHMICATLKGCENEYLAMNDVVLSRGGNPSCITVEVYADDDLIYTTVGDGIIAATATGSTGYCLAAGGPVLHPSLKNMVLLPICSHKGQQLPIVLDAKSKVRLHSVPPPGSTQQISFDGQTNLVLKDDADIRIEHSQYKVHFIRFETQKFFTRLRLKQAEWSGK
ncbi:MAG: NAD(+)/NADH kinase [Clostridiales bacterium]|nr:NAD(+)/NADH kinase [Clostridiales bacterium]